MKQFKEIDPITIEKQATNLFKKYSKEIYRWYCLLENNWFYFFSRLSIYVRSYFY